MRIENTYIDVDVQHWILRSDMENIAYMSPRSKQVMEYMQAHKSFDVTSIEDFKLAFVQTFDEHPVIVTINKTPIEE